MSIEEVFKNLLNAWEETKIEEQKPLEIAIDSLLNIMEKDENKTMELDDELRRYEGFKESQNKFDNVLSLLKICDKLDIEYNEEIDLNTCDLNKIEQTMNRIVIKQQETQNQYTTAKRDINNLWFAINKPQLKNGDEHELANSNITVGDIRVFIPYFDIE